MGTLTVVRVLRAPSAEQRRFFDGEQDDEGSFLYHCGNCGQEIEHEVWGFVGQTWDWERVFSAEQRTAIIELCQLPTKQWGTLSFLQSHEGAHPCIKAEPCLRCSTPHLLYIGFHEFQPARYIGTLQGVYQLA